MRFAIAIDPLGRRGASPLPPRPRTISLSGARPATNPSARADDNTIGGGRAVEEH